MVLDSSFTDTILVSKERDNWGCNNLFIAIFFPQNKLKIVDVFGQKKNKKNKSY